VPADEKSLWSKLFFPISAAIITVTVTIVIMLGYLFLPEKAAESKIIIIKPQLSVHKISLLLADEGIIQNTYLFNIISKIYSRFNSLKSGEYEFTAGMSPYKILLKLASGKSIVHRLVIPEGQTTQEIINRINAEDRLFGSITSNIAEGQLMPSTYFYSYGDQKEKIINKMRLNMSQSLNIVMAKLPANSVLKNKKDILIMASIIEKEAANDQERPIVAAVFLNRLRKNMKLQADPTVIYAITKGDYKLNRLLTRRDLQLDSRYNTYKYKGLPSGPITNPGMASLEAAVLPATTNVLYFVSDGNGAHKFSSTLRAHNVNVRAFRQFTKNAAIKNK
jgi:UPF0755 protein